MYFAFAFLVAHSLMFIFPVVNQFISFLSQSTLLIFNPPLLIPQSPLFVINLQPSFSITITCPQSSLRVLNLYYSSSISITCSQSPLCVLNLHPSSSISIMCPQSPLLVLNLHYVSSISIIHSQSPLLVLNLADEVVLVCALRISPLVLVRRGDYQTVHRGSCVRLSGRPPRKPDRLQVVHCGPHPLTIPDDVVAGRPPSCQEFIV